MSNSESNVDTYIHANRAAAAALLGAANDFDKEVEIDHMGTKLKAEKRAVFAMKAAASFMKGSTDPDVVKEGLRIAQQGKEFAKVHRVRVARERGDRVASMIHTLKGTYAGAVDNTASKLLVTTKLSPQKLSNAAQVCAIALYGANTGLGLVATAFASKKQNIRSAKYASGGAILHLGGMFAEALAQEFYQRTLVEETVAKATPTRH